MSDEFREFNDMESWSSEDWDEENWGELDAQVERSEEAETEGNWARQDPCRVPPAYQEVVIPGMLEHHTRAIVAYLGKMLGAMLRDRVKYVRTRDMIWARELVQDVAEICSMCWSAARSEDKPDDEGIAVKWLGWSVDNQLVTSQQLADAYWLADLHGAAGTNTPEDAMRLGISRKLNAEHNRPAPIGSDPTMSTHGEGYWFFPLELECTVFEFSRLHWVWVPGDPEIIDDTFEISKSEGYTHEEWLGWNWVNGKVVDSWVLKWHLLTPPGRVKSIRISDIMKKGDSRRDLFWFKFIEGESSKFWVGEGNTERALYKTIQDLEPVKAGKFTLKAKLGTSHVTIRVGPNPKAPATMAIPAAELLRIMAGLTDRWGNLRDESLAEMYRLALLLHGGKEIPEWAKHLSSAADAKLGSLISCIRGCVEDIHVAFWGAIVDSWRGILGIKPPPAQNQLPGFTLTCLRCKQPAKSIYSDGLCPTCHRTENPL